MCRPRRFNTLDYLRAKVFEVCGREPLIEVAIELERQALADEYFVSRSRCNPRTRPRSCSSSQTWVIRSFVQEAVPQRGFLQRFDLQGHGLPYRHLPRLVHHSQSRYVPTPLPADAQQLLTLSTYSNRAPVGWLAHWVELLDDPENKIVRPRQVYLGHDLRYIGATIFLASS
jgi:hypothetical protein